MGFRIISSAFKDGGFIPHWYARSGGDSSPPIGWTDPPENTASLALIVTCTDKDSGVEYCHWIVFNIPPNSGTIYGRQPHESRINDGEMQQGRNGFGNVGWDGPADEIPNQELVFTLYALDRRLALIGGVSCRDVRKAIEGHVLEKAELTGRYTPR